MPCPQVSDSPSVEDERRREATGRTPPAQTQFQKYIENFEGFPGGGLTAKKKLTQPGSYLLWAVATRFLLTPDPGTHPFSALSPSPVRLRGACDLLPGARRRFVTHQGSWPICAHCLDKRGTGARSGVRVGQWAFWGRGERRYQLVGLWAALWGHMGEPAEGHGRPPRIEQTQWPLAVAVGGKVLSAGVDRRCPGTHRCLQDAVGQVRCGGRWCRRQDVHADLL